MAMFAPVYYTAMAATEVAEGFAAGSLAETTYVAAQTAGTAAYEWIIAPVVGAVAGKAATEIERKVAEQVSRREVGAPILKPPSSATIEEVLPTVAAEVREEGGAVTEGVIESEAETFTTVPGRTHKGRQAPRRRKGHHGVDKWRNFDKFDVQMFEEPPTEVPEVPSAQQRVDGHTGPLVHSEAVLHADLTDTVVDSPTANLTPDRIDLGATAPTMKRHPYTTALLVVGVTVLITSKLRV